MRERIPIIGLVGGVGSGKSTLAAWLGRRRRVALLDADAAGHAALRRPEVRRRLRDQFGDAIFDAAGDVQRPRVAERVFGVRAEQVAARQTLESIVHPVIREQLEQELLRLRAAGEHDLILLDAAVMLEAGWSALCDAVIFIDTPKSLRAARVQASRGWSADELARREASQWPLDRKRAAADFVVDNSADLDAGGEALWRFLQTSFPGLSADQRAAVRAETPAAGG